MSAPGGAPAFTPATESNTPSSQRSSLSINNRKSAYGRDTMDRVSKDELMHSSDGRDGGRDSGGNTIQNPMFAKDSNNSNGHGSNRSDIEMRESSSAANGGRNNGRDGGGGISGRESDNIRESLKNLPEGRTPLVKAFDRSLSYLTESPSVSSPLTSNFYKYGGGQWRERYVMKSTGWNSANPDAGLPPARSTAGGGGSILGHSPPGSVSGSLLSYGSDSGPTLSAAKPFPSSSSSDLPATTSRQSLLSTAIANNTNQQSNNDNNSAGGSTVSGGGTGRSMAYSTDSSSQNNYLQRRETENEGDDSSLVFAMDPVSPPASSLLPPPVQIDNVNHSNNQEETSADNGGVAPRSSGNARRRLSKHDIERLSSPRSSHQQAVAIQAAMNNQHQLQQQGQQDQNNDNSK
jgi:hypothetical protein